MPQADIEAARNWPINEIWKRLGLIDPVRGMVCSPFREDKHPGCQVGGDKNIFFDYAAGVSLDSIDLVRKARGCDFQAAVTFVLKRLPDMETTNNEPITPTAQGTKPKARKLWADAGTAKSNFNTLPTAKNNQEILDFLQNDYGLIFDMIPDDWRAFDHPSMGLGVVYQGYDRAGESVYKFRSTKRDGKGKRYNTFLFGGAGNMSLGEPSEIGVLIVCGEEKAAMGAAAGYEVICPLTGEKALDAETIGLIVNSGDRPARIILANDNDTAGRKANQGTAKALVAAGYPGTQIYLPNWPNGAPEGFDINDVAKSGGVEAVKKLTKNASQYMEEGPRCLSAAEFLAVQRPPLRYHIEGILPYGGKLTFSATSKWGKSLWAIQTGMALAAGNCEWLGWLFGPPARVLYIQAEIMDGLVENRLRWMFEHMPQEINMERAGKNFIIREIAKGRPNLMSDTGRKDLEISLEQERPETLILDPMAALFPGMEENAAESMSLALDYVANLANRFECAVILIHHHSKAGAARGSSVFEAWPESDIQASFMNEEDRSVAKIIMKLRCAYNSGPLYWQMPSPTAPWFEKMPNDFEPSKGRGRPSLVQPEFVVTIIKANGQPIRWKDLQASLVSVSGISGSKAEKLICEAKDMGMITTGGGFYSVPGLTS